MEIKIITTQEPEYLQMCRLRNEILRKPIGLQMTEEEKKKDTEDILIVCLENEIVIGCCILSRLDNTTLRLRQMAVDTNWQGRGVGQKIINFAEKYAIDNHYKKVMMHARKTAIDFYKKQGYKICSPEFVEVGILHYEMEKSF